jgi:hypothetical protein
MKAIIIITQIRVTIGASYPTSTTALTTLYRWIRTIQKVFRVSCLFCAYYRYSYIVM